MEENALVQYYEQEIVRIQKEMLDAQDILDKWHFKTILLTIDVLNSSTRRYKEECCKTLLAHLRDMPKKDIDLIINNVPF